MASRSKIIERVKKLLAISTSHVNENEASATYSAAQELISKYQIEEAELNAKTNIPLVIVHDMIDSGNKSSILWKERLVGSLTEVNHCDFIIEKNSSLEDGVNGSSIYFIFGQETNVELIKILFNLISNQIEYFAKSSTCRGKSEMNSFKLGITTRVGQRLKDSKDKIESEYLKLSSTLTNTSTNTNALVRFEEDKTKIRSFALDFFKVSKLKKGSDRKINLKKEAYSAGLQKGDSVVLTNNKALT